MDTIKLQTLRLSDLATSETGIITRVAGYGAFRKRITEMGFVRGKKVTVIKNAPLRDPIEYEIMGYRVSLRRSEAHMIEIVTGVDEALPEIDSYFGSTDDNSVKDTVLHTTKTINIALVGNPNCGKTTLFNLASGAHERVGNYGGVTVDSKEAEIKSGGYTLKLTDLPGTYSITEYTPEELFVRGHIIDSSPDVIINVIDSSNLERNLFLTTQLIDMHVKVVIALNMFDELEKSGVVLDTALLGKLLGIPVIPTVASKGRGIKELLNTVISIHEETNPIQRYININYGEDIEAAIGKIKPLIENNPSITDKYAPRYLAVKLLEQDKATAKELIVVPNFETIEAVTNTQIRLLEEEFNEKSATIITDAKYGFIAGALGETLTAAPHERRKQVKEIDNLLTHKLFGFPIFLFFMWLMFQATFTLGSYPMDLIDAGVGLFGDFVKTSMAEGPLRDLLVDGIIGGVGGVIIFMPNILLLFFFISLMEDSGYMARAAFIMDRLMHKIGLHGKSFIPLLMGFGCNVPAIMATRTLENKKDRILTMLITPFMSCSARLPVYVLVISATFTAYQGTVLLGMYLAGVAIAVIVALIMKKVAFAKQDVPFVMELPPYRVPTLRNTTKHMWFKGVQYLNKMGTVILLASILIWALGYFPRDVQYSQDYDAQISAITQNNSLKEDVKTTKTAEIETLKESERQANSYIGKMGRFIEPAIAPLGFDWKIGVAIITGLAAKEIVVSTMGVLYQAGLEEDENSNSLKDKLQQQVYSSGVHKGEKVFTPLVSIGFMLFILIYFPCVAVIAAIRKESDWKWAAFTMVYTTAIAYAVAFITYQTGRLFL